MTPANGECLAKQEKRQKAKVDEPDGTDPPDWTVPPVPLYRLGEQPGPPVLQTLFPQTSLSWAL